MKIKIAFALALVISINASSQIKLPKQFRCVLSKESFRENYFTDGNYRLKTDAWGNGAAESAEDVQPYIEGVYDHQLSFRKTKDGLAWGTGFYNGKYYYIVVIPKSFASVTLSSTSKGTEFSNYSSWLLQQVRNNISSDMDFYLTDYKGKECSAE